MKLKVVVTYNKSKTRQGKEYYIVSHHIVNGIGKSFWVKTFFMDSLDSVSRYIDLVKKYADTFDDPGGNMFDCFVAFDEKILPIIKILKRYNHCKVETIEQKLALATLSK